MKDSTLVKDSIPSIDTIQTIAIKAVENKNFNTLENKNIQYQGKLQKIKSAKGRFQIKLPQHLESKTNLIHNGEANTSTLTTFDTIYIDSIPVHINFTLVSFFTKKNMAELFQHDTMSIIHDYQGEVLEHRRIKIKKHFSRYHISSSEMDGFNIYSASFYFHGKKQEEYFLISTNILSKENISLEKVRYHLLYFYRSIESFKVK